MAIDIKQGARKLLVLLLLTDVVFIVLHILLGGEQMSNVLFSIKTDFGYAEVYQYIKEYWIVLMLFFLALKAKEVVYFFWSALFMYFLLDDSLSIHERVGRRLVTRLDIQSMPYLQAQEFGELAVLVLFGSLIFLFIGCAYLFSSPRMKKISTNLLILSLFVAFFGVAVELLHSASSWGDGIWGLIEDGGEMLIMSIIVCYVFALQNGPGEMIEVSEKSERPPKDPPGS